MTAPYHKLQHHFKRIAKIDHALTFLHWDHMVMMPPGGGKPRSEAIAELTAMRHELLTLPEVGDLLNEAKAIPLQHAIEEKSLAEMARTYRQAVCLPTNLVKAKTLAGSRCEHGWRSQRTHNDWQGFLENFKEVVLLAREEAVIRKTASEIAFNSPYDALLDLYCTGDSSDFIDSIFVRLKMEIPSLLIEIREKQCLSQPLSKSEMYSVEQQRILNRILMERLGFDFNRGRQDTSAHPFSTGCRGDQRITTRFREVDFIDALMATAHETGHASYEDNLPEEWDGLPIGQARNLCLHESQSLLFEKQLFLRKPFFFHFTSQIHKYLPNTTQYSPEMLWQAATLVQPSLIRVEADEVTYPLHIIIRYEIEKPLINGEIEASDIPELWNEKMMEYLGLTTKGNYTDGCLQDMHWSDGTFGYFPSYTIGALNSAQLFATIRTTYPDWQTRLAIGDISFVRNWLRQQIWSKGSSMTSQELLMAATEHKTEPEYFLQHLRDRYLDERS